MTTEIELDIEKLEKEVETQRNLLNTDRLDMSFGEIMSMYEREEIIIRPAFQRYFRWDDEQKTRFIESILLGIPIPPIFVAEDDKGVWELVDGLQRISTILSFFGILRDKDEGIKKKNNWVLLQGDRVDSLEGFSCENLPNKFRLNIKRATCRVEIIRWNSDYDMRFELFNRLNTGGSSLTPQEIRNAIYRDISSEFNDFLLRLAEFPEFKDTIDISEKQLSELYDQELVLRFCSLFDYNTDEISENLSQHLSSFMKNAVQNPNFDYSYFENIFTRVIRLLAPIGKGVFKGLNYVFSPTIFEAIMVGIGENIESYEKLEVENLKGKIDELKNNPDFKKYAGTASNNRYRYVNRLKVAKKIFAEIPN
ncbi:MAG: DUF262 domain-containing protein [Microscillaceae bacterium]|jgi:hypothetical protein|nr:DUF262 domain-containing protein [Microscillaceae bacterium]